MQVLEQVAAVRRSSGAAATARSSRERSDAHAIAR